MFVKRSGVVFQKENSREGLLTSLKNTDYANSTLEHDPSSDLRFGNSIDSPSCKGIAAEPRLQDSTLTVRDASSVSQNECNDTGSLRRSSRRRVFPREWWESGSDIIAEVADDKLIIGRATKKRMKPSGWRQTKETRSRLLNTRHGRWCIAQWPRKAPPTNDCAKKKRSFQNRQ